VVRPCDAVMSQRASDQGESWRKAERTVTAIVWVRECSDKKPSSTHMHCE
jgi:hypothetical protein